MALTITGRSIQNTHARMYASSYDDGSAQYLETLVDLFKGGPIVSLGAAFQLAFRGTLLAAPDHPTRCADFFRVNVDDLSDNVESFYMVLRLFCAFASKAGKAAHGNMSPVERSELNTMLRTIGEVPVPDALIQYIILPETLGRVMPQAGNYPHPAAHNFLRNATGWTCVAPGAFTFDLMCGALTYGKVQGTHVYDAVTLRKEQNSDAIEVVVSVGNECRNRGGYLCPDVCTDENVETKKGAKKTRAASPNTVYVKVQAVMHEDDGSFYENETKRLLKKMASSPFVAARALDHIKEQLKAKLPALAYFPMEQEALHRNQFDVLFKIADCPSIHKNVLKIFRETADGKHARCVPIPAYATASVDELRARLGEVEGLIETLRLSDTTLGRNMIIGTWNFDTFEKIVQRAGNKMTKYVFSAFVSHTEYTVNGKEANRKACASSGILFVATPILNVYHTSNPDLKKMPDTVVPTYAVAVLVPPAEPKKGAAAGQRLLFTFTASCLDAPNACFDPMFPRSFHESHVGAYAVEHCTAIFYPKFKGIKLTSRKPKNVGERPGETSDAVAKTIVDCFASFEYYTARVFNGNPELAVWWCQTSRDAVYADYVSNMELANVSPVSQSHFGFAMVSFVCPSFVGKSGVNAHAGPVFAKDDVHENALKRALEIAMNRTFVTVKSGSESWKQYSSLKELIPKAPSAAASKSKKKTVSSIPVVSGMHKRLLNAHGLLAQTQQGDIILPSETTLRVLSDGTGVLDVPVLDMSIDSVMKPHPFDGLSDKQKSEFVKNKAVAAVLVRNQLPVFDMNALAYAEKRRVESSNVRELGLFVQSSFNKIIQRLVSARAKCDTTEEAIRACSTTNVQFCKMQKQITSFFGKQNNGAGQKSVTMLMLNGGTGSQRPKNSSAFLNEIGNRPAESDDDDDQDDSDEDAPPPAAPPPPAKKKAAPKRAAAKPEGERAAKRSRPAPKAKQATPVEQAAPAPKAKPGSKKKGVAALMFANNDSDDEEEEEEEEEVHAAIPRVPQEEDNDDLLAYDKDDDDVLGGEKRAATYL